MEIKQDFKFFKQQAQAFYHILDLPTREYWYVGGFGSLASGSQIIDITGKEYTIGEIYKSKKSIKVQALDFEGNPIWTQAMPPVLEGTAKMYDVELKNGKQIRVTADHRFLTKEGWKELKDLTVGSEIAIGEVVLDAPCAKHGVRLLSESASSRLNCLMGQNQYGGQLRQNEDYDQVLFPTQTYEFYSILSSLFPCFYHLYKRSLSLLALSFFHRSYQDILSAYKALLPSVHSLLISLKQKLFQKMFYFLSQACISFVSYVQSSFYNHAPFLYRSLLRYKKRFVAVFLTVLQYDFRTGLSLQAQGLSVESLDQSFNNINYIDVISIVRTKEDCQYFDIHVPKYNNYLANGIYHHNSGKSFTGAKLVEAIAMKYQGIRIAMIRDTLVNFKNTSLKTFLEVVDNRLFTHNQSTNTIKFKNGSEAVYFGLDDTQAIQRLQSLELGFLWVDEVDGVPERVYNIATKRLRQTSPDEKAQFKAKQEKKRYKEERNIMRYPRKALVTSNSAGQNWTWNRFVKKPKALTGWTRAISATNTSLPKEYLDSLEEMRDTSPDDYKRYVQADFNIFEGQIYKEWSEEENTCEPFDIPSSWARMSVLDYGLRNQTAIIYVAISPEGISYVYDEYYKSGQTPNKHAEDLKAHGFSEALADPSIFNKNQAKGDYIYSIADEYEENGIQMFPAQNDHVAGRSYFKKMLGNRTFIVMNNCLNTIRTIPAMKWKKPRMIQGVEIIDEQEAQGQEDHLPDVCRYYCMERYQPKHVFKTPEQLEDAFYKLKNPLTPSVEVEKLKKELEEENDMLDFEEGLIEDDSNDNW